MLGEQLHTGKVVTVSKDHLNAYGYKGKGTSFKVLKSSKDNYSRVYNLEDEQGKLLIGVMEEDLVVQ